MKPSATAQSSQARGSSSEPVPTTVPTLLLVDDEPDVLRLLGRHLADEGYDIVRASTIAEALDVLRARPVHVLLSDHNLAESTGLDLLRKVRMLHPTVVRLMMTASREFDVVVGAINQGEVARMVTKPWREDDLRCTLRLAFEQAALDREVRKLRRLAREASNTLATLERDHPGITKLRRDGRGAIELDEIDEAGAIKSEHIWTE